MVSNNDNNDLMWFLIHEIFLGANIDFWSFWFNILQKKEEKKIQFNFVIIFCGCQTSKVLQIYAYVTLVSIWNNKKSGAL